jgi:hypothetical protein
VTATHAAAAKAAAQQAAAAAAAADASLTDVCHPEEGAEYAGEDVIEWGTNHLKVQHQTHFLKVPQQAGSK